VQELGTIMPGDNSVGQQPLPDVYWSAAAAYWAYLYGHLAVIGIDVASMSQLAGGVEACAGANCTQGLGPPYAPGCVCRGSNFASVTMLRWDQGGRPTARFWVLKLLIDAFGNREKRLLQTVAPADGEVYAQAFEVDGRKKLLVVNKSPEPQQLPLADPAFAKGASVAGILTQGARGPPSPLGLAIAQDTYPLSVEFAWDLMVERKLSP
jgi:hypothetical protein